MNADTNHEFARGFMTEDEIAEIIEAEDDLNIDLEGLMEELESEDALLDSIDAESDWAD